MKALPVDGFGLYDFFHSFFFSELLQMVTTTSVCVHKSKVYSNHWRVKQSAANVIHDAKNARAMDSIHRFVQNVAGISVASNVKMNAQRIRMQMK